VNNDVFKLEVDGRTFEVILNGSGFTVDGDEVEASVVRVNGNTFSLLVDGRSHEFTIIPNESTTSVSGISGSQQVEILDRIAQLLRESASSSKSLHLTEVRAPMPGLVLKVEVGQGDEVHHGSGLVVLEAMKMENEIFATGEGVVAAVHVVEGQPVTKGQLLITLE
jgi:biotin carboxyl carrier protein